jgi:glyoxylase-like metal-dependent hydrolase (beta-lactamase superfamily II)
MNRGVVVSILSVALGSVAIVGAQQTGAGSAAEVHVLPIRGNLSMLVAPDGSNSAISIGEDGVFLVDTMSAASAQALLTAFRTLAGPKALRWIVNTSSHPDHAGGNAVLAPAGRLIASGNTRGGNAASIYAFQETMMRLNGSAPGKDAVAPEGWPTDSFFVTQKKMFFNDEGVLLIHVPSASTDGDTIVMFRRSDVIAAGDTFTPQQYPIIDLDEGGSINGYIAGLNHLIDLTVTSLNEEGGTLVVPGHGHLCDEADVGDYRDMVTIVRDRVQELIKKKMTLDQVKAAKVTFDYDGVYATPEYSGDQFVERVYKSLTQPQKPAAAVVPKK